MTRSILSLDDLTVNNLGTFKKINSVVLPTSYSDQWYQESLQHIVKLAFYSELPVGAIKGRAINFSPNQTFESIVSQPPPDKEGKETSKNIPNAIYIESLGVLKSYRGLGVGSLLIQYVIDEAKKRFIHKVYIHVLSEDEDTIRWYCNKGFEKGPLVKDYYKQQGLSSPDAILMSLDV